MCSIPGLPSPGSDVSVHITRIHLNPLCILVEFWGNFDQDQKLAYQRMRKEIQFPKDAFHGSEGNPGDLCLVRIYETWYRARIVSRNGSLYSVFLIDEGRTLRATTNTLAWGQSDYFHLPPEVEFCVLANVLPLSPENKWSPMAFEFLKTICGRTVKAFVQDVLVPHRTFLLDIPGLSRQLYEMGLARTLSVERFKEFVTRSLQSQTESVEGEKISSLRSEPAEVTEQIEKHQCYMYPELHNETVETVIVTEVTNPFRIFCQLKVFSQELKKLTDQITFHYEGRLGKSYLKPEVLGSPCAARGSDGKWYRSVIKQVMSSSSVVEVLHVDYGRKQSVQVENVRPLASEFFRMPVVTYVCSLHGVTDRGVGWTRSQIDYLKSLLLNRTVIAKFEYQSLSEGVHYVTLYGDGNTNINNLFSLRQKSLVKSDDSQGDYLLCKHVAPQKCQNLKADAKCTNPLSSGHFDEQEPFSIDSIPLNSSHLAVVHHVESPSKFWVQTQRFTAEFDQLMTDLAELYSDLDSAEGVIRDPVPGLLCAAKSQDDAFYRAVIHEVLDEKAKVYFFDYGNSEIVDCFSLRVLPTLYQKLPALALKCTLSDIRPKGDRWSQRATLLFSKTVADRVLNLHVCDKSQDTYVVRLSDPALDGEKDLSKLLCSAGFAYAEKLRKPVDSTASRPQIVFTEQDPQLRPDVCETNTWPLQSPAHNPTATESKSSFKEYLFPIGSSLEVIVSYIESPNDFWCQMANNAGCLKLLMQDIQNYYANSEFQHPLEAACVARHPENGLWYRALIIQKHPTPEVDVLFVDYGQTKRVAVQEIRSINPAFLKLKGQAFRCSLYNLIHPASTLDWSADATAQFQEFVDVAASMNVVLKCTIYAVMYDAHKVVFNVVDLETPFQSICSLLVQRGLANRAPPKKAPLPPFRLDTYYYSTHNIKTGSEEEVSITCVRSVNQFYCHLRRNSKDIKRLSDKVNYLCRQLKFIECPQTFGTVCFAKYTDDQWYRGQIKSTKPSIVVNFVDYGDMLEIERSDLLPVPIEAGEIMSMPVQAVECGLSDIPEDVQSEVNSWFEDYVIDRSLKALVVAKDPSGKLIVELYDGKSQVNAKIRERFRIEIEREEVTSKGKDFRSKKSADVKAERAPHVEVQPRHENPTLRHRRENLSGQQWSQGYKGKRSASEPFKTTKKRSNDQRQVSSQDESEHAQTQRMCSHVPEQENSIVGTDNMQTHSRLGDLPLKILKPGMEADIFVSHCNSPWSFFVQLATDEDEIYSLVEKLNQTQLGSEHIDLSNFCEGDLLSAIFPEDNSWYRAVVRERTNSDTVNVEFIDFGNTAEVSGSQICGLAKSFLGFPRFSIHCSLSEVDAINGEDKDTVSIFKNEIAENAATLKCQFIKQTDTKWEVKLEASGAELGHNSVSEDNRALTTMEPESLCAVQELPAGDTVCSFYREMEMSAGQTLEVYASSIVGPQYFWCQYAESDKLQKISDDVQKAAEIQKPLSRQSLSLGNACIALFTEDKLWYRAKVISKQGDMLSVLFVDYGNESEVHDSEVRELPTELADVPPQAFACQLEGFDVSEGSWVDGAADRFSDSVTDRLMKLTVLRLGCTEDKEIPHYVKVECDEHVVSDMMKDFWKSFNSEGVFSEPTEGSSDLSNDPAVLVSDVKCPEESIEISMDHEFSSQISEAQPSELDYLDANTEVLSEQVITVKATGEVESSAVEHNLVCGQRNDGEFRSEMEIKETEVEGDESLPVKTDLDGFEVYVERGEPEKNTNTIEDSDFGTTSNISATKGQSLSEITECPSESLLHLLSDVVCLVQPVSSQPLSPECSDESGVSPPFVSIDALLNDSDSALYIDEKLEQSSQDQSHSDLYEDVFGGALPVESVESEQALGEEKGIDDNPEVIKSDHGNLRRATKMYPVGSECVVWSHANKNWCRARILKISLDSVLVLLLEHDSEMVVDPFSIFEIISEEPSQAKNDETDADADGRPEEPKGE
ncbi:tudor domain-containing 6 [Chanos chanos]|uniref:Tudor domain-containing 6 n=1 Tax=Chanos chanos TaxID=29144 RepID=A0A6J2V8F6_CHACN|nr:tudor domain-containing protein 6 [Chanos chanos]